jgi:hypothetical protein
MPGIDGKATEEVPRGKQQLVSESLTREKKKRN